MIYLVVNEVESQTKNQVNRSRKNSNRILELHPNYSRFRN